MTDRPRRWPLAGFLSLWVPGLGQLYNGEWAKALVILAVSIPIGIGLVLLLFSPWFHLVVPLALLTVLALWAYALIDAIVVARRLGGSYELKPYNRVFVYLAIVVAFGIVRGTFTELFRSTFIQAFRVPAESMLPTLQVGDYVFVDRRPAARIPTRGDVIVFKYPEDPSRQYIKRVVAVPGDRVEVRDKQLFVNGHAPQEPYVVHIDPSTHPGEFDPRDNFGSFMVPPGSYFVLGDNRDNSNDSRFFGPIKRASVDGKLRGIYWSWDAERREVRWNRVGRRFE